MAALLLGFPEYVQPARRLAQAAGLPFEAIETHRFPDGESRVRLPAELPRRVILCRSLDRPNDKLIELALAGAAARAAGVEELVLVAPYLCYMRQDTVFHPGEAVSQQIIGQLLAQWFDSVITVDPHLHRVHDMRQAVPARCSLALTATAAIAEHLAGCCNDPVLIGPDEESAQWVAAVADKQGLDYVVGRKRRLGDREVEVELPPGDYAGRELVLLDDMASTGRTLEAAARAAAAYRPVRISAVVTHALFVGDALQRLEQGGISRIWSTDSIPHPSNAIALAPLLAQAL